MIQKSKETNKNIILLILVVITKGCLWAIMVPRWLVPDEFYYFEYTRFILAEGGLPNVLQTPAAGHPPLYPALASVPYLLGRPFGQNTQLLLMRFMGVAFEVLIIYFTFKLVKAIFPKSETLQLAVPALLAFNPQFSFIMASANSDTLLILIATIWFYALSVYVVENKKMTLKQLFWLVIILGVGLLTKQRFRIPMALAPIILTIDIFRRLPSRTMRNIHHLPSVITIPLISLPFSWSLFTRNDLPKRLFTGFWGNFGWWQYIPLRQSTYYLLLWTTWAALIGLAIFIVDYCLRIFVTARQSEDHTIMVGQLIIIILSIIEVLLAIYSTVVYNYLNRGANARYMFAAIVPAYILLTVGLKKLIPTIIENHALVILLAAAFFLNFHALFFIVTSFYYGVST